jgi:hypothetical protein
MFFLALVGFKGLTVRAKGLCGRKIFRNAFTGFFLIGIVRLVRSVVWPVELRPPEGRVLAYVGPFPGAEPETFAPSSVDG